ncbi:MAG: citrate transporter [Aeromonadaceae bacterium]|nr:citrate transporter [Aeromonadaceae bacterium]
MKSNRLSWYLPKLVMAVLLFFVLPSVTWLMHHGTVPSLGGIRLEFILFAATLLGVALYHNHTMWVALLGLMAILFVKYLFDDSFSFLAHLFGHGEEHGEWRILLNLIGLLFGFAILAKHFDASNLPQWFPRVLPTDWRGGFLLLVLVFVFSSFLDNIAAAMIGGAMAYVMYNGKVHIGYLAALVAASNAGGSGSVVGDTTTTLMWIDGVAPIEVLHAYVAAAIALLVFGVIAAKQQDKYQPMLPTAENGCQIDKVRLLVVALILVMAIVTNYLFDFPALGVWVAILVGALLTKTPWDELKHALPGTIFLVALVTCASLMPVEQLPAASWQTALGLGFISAVFDNIPLTKLCLEQGGYDWGVLAYSVGFGGSMLWFGSSAGVALSGMFPQARSVVLWLKHGWHIPIAYVIGFMVLLLALGWHPLDHKAPRQSAETVQLAHP